MKKDEIVTDEYAGLYGLISVMNPDDHELIKLGHSPELFNKVREDIELNRKNRQKSQEELPPMSVEEFLMDPNVTVTTKPGTVTQITGYPKSR